jgi:hypothetical protein
MLKPKSLRYQLMRLWQALELSWVQQGTGPSLWTRGVGLGAPSGLNKSSPSATTLTGSLLERVTQNFSLPLTASILLTGAAMAPALNPSGVGDRDAVEKLIVRLLPRPSMRNVLVRDAVPRKFGSQKLWALGGWPSRDSPPTLS